MEPTALGLLTAAQAARRLGCRPHVVLKAIKSGRLTAVRLGRYWAVADDEHLAAFAAALAATARKRARQSKNIRAYWQIGHYDHRRKPRFELVAVPRLVFLRRADIGDHAPDEVPTVCPKCTHQLRARVFFDLTRRRVGD